MTAFRIIGIVAAFAALGFGVYKYEFNDGQPATTAQMAVFEANYAKLDDAQCRWNPAVEFGFETEDYSQVRINGQEWSKYVELREMQHATGLYSNITSKTTVDSVLISGDTAIVRTHNDFSANVRAGSGYPGKYETDSDDFQDTWVQAGSDWKLKQSKTLSVQTKFS